MTATRLQADGGWASRRTPAIWFFLLSAVALPVMLFTLAATAFHPDLTVVILQGLIVLYASVHLSIITAQGYRHPMQLGFWLFVYVWMGIAGLVQEAAGTSPFLFLQSPDRRATAALIVLTGLAAYDVGVLVARLWRGHGTRLGDRGISLSRTHAVAIAGLLALPLVIPELGGIAALFSSRDAVSQSLTAQGLSTADSKAGAGIYTALATVPLFLALLILARSHPKSTIDKALLGLVVAANLVVNNPISNARFWFGTMCFAILYTSPRLRRPGLWKCLPAALILVLLVGFPYADRFRYSVQTSSYGIIDSITIKGDYDTTAQTANVVAYVDTLGHTNGHQLEGALLFWLPRSIWPDKALDTGTLVGEFVNFQNLNLSCPLWAEGYIDFGWLGVIMLLGLLGYCSRRADVAYERQLGHSAGVTLAGIVVPVLAGYEFLILRGSLLEAMGQLVAILVLSLLLSQMSTARRLHLWGEDDGARMSAAIPVS